MNNTKLNVYKNVLQEVYEKFNGTEQLVQQIIKELCKGKLSVEEVTYLLMNDGDNF